MTSLVQCQHPNCRKPLQSNGVIAWCSNDHFFVYPIAESRPAVTIDQQIKWLGERITQRIAIARHIEKTVVTEDCRDAYMENYKLLDMYMALLSSLEQFQLVTTIICKEN